LLGLALVAGIVALNQRGEARDAARVADAQRLGVEALGEERLDQALLRTRTAVELDESSATLGNMLSVLLRNPAAVGVLDYGWVMYGAALSPDGRLMAVGDERGSVVIYDAASRRPVAPPYRIQSGLIQNVRFSPDGGTLAVSYMELVDPVHPKFDLIDARTARRTLHVELPVLSQPAEFIYTDVVFPPDERELLARPVSSSYPDAPAAPIYRVDRQTGDLAGRLRVGRFASSFYGSETADRRSLFITSLRDDKTWQLDTDTLRVVRSWPVGGFAAAASPDGTAVALTTMSGELRLLDLARGDVRPFSGRHDDAINRIEFTPDGRRLVTADAGGQLFVWDVARGTIAQRLAGHARGIDGLDISNDGRTLLTASQDTRAILWDLAGDRRLDRRFFVGRSFAVNHTPRGIAVSPDGRTLALTHSDGVVDLLDTRTLRRRASVRALDGYAASVAFSPDGRLLAVTGEEGELKLWNARTLAPAGELEGMKGVSQALAFSPNGEELAAVEAATSAEAVSATPQPLRVWDPRSGAPTGFRAQSTANLLAYSPDGKLLAAAATERGTEIREASTGKLIERLVNEGESRSVAFSPDGELLFVGQYDGAGRLFSTRTWRPVGQALEGAHTARITFPAFTPDGRTLVTAAADGTVVLWDVDTQTQIGAPLRLAPNTFASAALSPDGSRLYAISTRGEGISFNMSPEAWKRHACLVAGRELTPAEWKAALPERPYEPVCSGD
jgi:WD40 repeat protein